MGDVEVPLLPIAEIHRWAGELGHGGSAGWSRATFPGELVRSILRPATLPRDPV